MDTERSLVPAAKRSLGQNFLVHGSAARKIAALVCHDSPEAVVELGAGTGNLTVELAKRSGRVIAFEIDERLVHWHERQHVLPENVELRRADILNISYQALAAELGNIVRVAGNLPYNISTQVVFSVCRQSSSVSEAFFLFQREVAERIVSSPGTKTYGVLSVVAQYSARVRKEFDLSPDCFRPRPKVWSSLVSFDFCQGHGDEDVDYDFFIRTVKASFSQRRKKIINCLAQFFRKKKPEMEAVLIEAGINPGARAEVLDVADFVTLSRVLLKKMEEAR